MRTARRKPSAAASVSEPPPILSSTPASTGRVSSGAAAKTTSLIASFSSADGIEKLGAAADGRNGREILGVDAGDVGLVPTARQMDLVRLGVQLELDLLAVVEQRDVVGQQPRRQRDLAFARDRGRHAMGHRQLEVVGRELQLAVARREQDVAQDRQRALGRHDPADDGEAFGEVLLQALELHRV